MNKMNTNNLKIKRDISDLSFSGIVSTVNHDIQIAKDFLIQIAEEKESVCNEIQELEIKLQHLITKELQLRKGALLVLKHIKKETPLVVSSGETTIFINEKNIKIERNVL